MGGGVRNSFGKIYSARFKPCEYGANVDVLRAPLVRGRYLVAPWHGSTGPPSTFSVASWNTHAELCVAVFIPYK